MTITKVDPIAATEALAEILHACVAEGASVNFVLPFSFDEARAFWRRPIDRIVLGAWVEGRLAGTVSLVPAPQPNQPHRADVAKLLVHPGFRRRGVARALMARLEETAREMGRTLLVLDTEEGSGAEPLYEALGYVHFGTVPGFALSADGRSRKGASFFYKELSP
jgi:GNAT superfamily N-acetyltransferase